MDTNMSIVDLAEIFEVVEWSEGQEEHDSGGLFIKLPRELAKQFPPKEQDKSPAHITLCYIENINSIPEEKLLNVIQDICSQIKPFPVRFGPNAKSFPKGDDGEPVIAPVKSSKLIKFHSLVKDTLRANQISADAKFPDYTPHVTIGYANSRKEKRALKDIRPTGEFMVQQIWIWGLTSGPQLVTLGKK
jgi:2'-5' RNA ligase